MEPASDLSSVKHGNIKSKDGPGLCIDLQQLLAEALFNVLPALRAQRLSVIIYVVISK